MPQQVEAPTKSLAEVIDIVAANAGWITLNSKDGNVTELRLNPDVHGGLVISPRSRNPLRKFGELFCKRGLIPNAACHQADVKGQVRELQQVIGQKGYRRPP